MLAAPKILLLATLAFCTFSATVSPQTPSAATDGKPQDDGPKTPFVFKTSSRLVVVDVVATNSKGEPVKDLKAGDFVVTEEGSAQTISSFSFQQPTVDSGGPRPAAEQLPPGVITNTP
ncbi:MAG TPA: hypothetical protein VH724_13930, partial [Candidatus Angelobacter sp.]|nr:hypothetical protein [Candidatus Angelobacter sp.]